MIESYDLNITMAQERIFEFPNYCNFPYMRGDYSCFVKNICDGYSDLVPGIAIFMFVIALSWAVWKWIEPSLSKRLPEKYKKDLYMVTDGIQLAINTVLLLGSAALIYYTWK